MVIFADAKRSFELNQDFENLKTVEGLISNARIFIREVKDLIVQYTPIKKSHFREETID